jgi:hypothetical protein
MQFTRNLKQLAGACILLTAIVFFAVSKLTLDRLPTPIFVTYIVVGAVAVVLMVVGSREESRSGIIPKVRASAE